MKNKGINEDTKILTIPSLLARVDEELEKQLAERKRLEAENQESLNAAIQKERGLVDEIGKAKNIAKKMIAEFRGIEIEAVKEKRKEAEGTALREADVRSGKAKLEDFHKKGKWDKAISDETRKESTAELEQTLKVIREKNLEILMLEDSLGECRNTIRGLSMRPGRFMLEFLKTIREFTEDEMGAFLAEMEGYRFSWNQVKEKILLTQGKTMSGRHVWSGLTMDEARDLQFSPLLPTECIEKLKSELDTYEGADGIALTLYVKLKTIEITSLTPRRGLLQTTDVKEDPTAKLKRR